MPFVVAMWLVLHILHVEASEEMYEVYCIRSDAYVPVFTVPTNHLVYEVGFHGNNCNNLLTVLLPGSYVQVDEKINKTIFKVSCLVSENEKVSGYIHPSFVKSSMTLTNYHHLDQVEVHRTVPSIAEMMRGFYESAKAGIPYCYGGNCPKEITLEGLYTFTQSDHYFNRTRSYVCQGFDSAGLLHYYSNGYLPHNPGKLIHCGKVLFKIEPKQRLTSRMLKEIMLELKDTDYIVFASTANENAEELGHVIVSYRFGFIESRGQNYGIVITPSYDAEGRLLQMKLCAAQNGCDLYVIRWHPQLLRWR